GSSRSAARSAFGNDSVCGPSSRWLIRHFFDSCMNSIGSSIVRMWPYSFSLTWLHIAASVVDLPEPVGPVHRMRPRGRLVSSPKIFGAFNSSSERTFAGMVRNAAAAPRIWTNALTRKRARLGTAKLKSHSRFSSYALRWASLMMSYTMAWTSSCSIGGRLIRRMSPWTRIMGGSPAERCRSDALFLTAKASSSVMSIYNPRSRKSWIAAQYATACNSHTSRGILMPASFDYVPLREAVARRADACRPGGARRRAAAGKCCAPGRQQVASSGGDPGALRPWAALVRGELCPGGPCQDGGALRPSGDRMAPDRPAAEQQDWGGIRSLRVGPYRRPAAHRRSAIGVAPQRRAAAQRLPPGQYQRRNDKKRRAAAGRVGARSRGGRVAAAQATGLHGDRRADSGHWQLGRTTCRGR